MKSTLDLFASHDRSGKAGFWVTGDEDLLRRVFIRVDGATDTLTQAQVRSQLLLADFH
jgi:hypothetical protein